MKIKWLGARDFRNFSNLRVALRPRLNFFWGENGQGKTNLVEAVFLLCRGNSFRPSDAASLISQQPGSNGRARVAGSFVRSSLEYLVEMSLENGDGRSKKSATINGKRANSSNLMSHFPIVLFSPESLSAIKEGPEQRRQLIDEILISHDPKQARLLSEYSRALRSRNRLLKILSEAPHDDRHARESLDSLDRIYLLLSAHLSTARIQALKDLAPDFTETMRSILDQPSEDISVDYLISGASALEWSDSQVYDALTKRHAELRAQERHAGSSLVGPHKHDIKLLFAGNDSRFYCSQGQQRALILALKIAQIVYHHRVHQTFPVLLLDDVLSELDAKKRANLMKFLEGISAQILITSTDLTWSKQFGAGINSVFRVAGGTVTAVEGSADLDLSDQDGGTGVSPKSSK